MLRPKSVWDRGQILFLKCSFQDGMFDFLCFKYFTSIVDHFSPKLIDFLPSARSHHHLQLFSTTSFRRFWGLCFGRLQSCHHHHHDVVPQARISLTLSRHFSLSFIASGRSSGLHPVSSHSCWMYVRAGRPDFARPYVGVHRSTSLMSSSLLLQQCPTCLVRLTWIVFVMGGRWPYSWCLVGCCRQDLFNTARVIV